MIPKQKYECVFKIALAVNYFRKKTIKDVLQGPKHYSAFTLTFRKY